MTYQPKPMLPADLKDYKAPSASPLKLSIYISTIFVLWAWAMTMDYSYQKEDEEMTMERIEAIAIHRTNILVACAKGQAISVGPKLIFCDSYDMPLMR